MKKYSYAPQSRNWDGYVVAVPEEGVGEYESSKGLRCSLRTAQDGHTTLVQAVGGGGEFFLRQLKLSGVVQILRGEGHEFLASTGSWSGGSNLHGAIALKPGALMRVGARGSWSYLVADEDGIRQEETDPRLWEEEGSQRWKPLA